VQREDHTRVGVDYHMKLLKVADVAMIMNTSVDRVYELARLGLLPVVHLGRQIRVEESALVEWIKTGGAPLPGGWRKIPS
jgi:excisionase family DNA binding protein